MSDYKTKHPLYGVWKGIKARCRTKTHPGYADYGGRGIQVCERWLGSFWAFVEDMGPRPSGWSIERKDVNGNYEPSNCIWATQRTQSRNTTRTHRLMIEGREYLAIDLSEQTGLKVDTILGRHRKGMTLAEITAKTVYRNMSGLALGGLANGERQKAKTHCPRGHELTADNVYLSPQGWRTCKICHKAKTARQASAKRALAHHQ